MGPAPAPLPDRAHGQAELLLTIDSTLCVVYVSCRSSWHSADGQAQESKLELQGDPEEGWEMISECSTWLWKRWKRPLNMATLPFVD